MIKNLPEKETVVFSTDEQTDTQAESYQRQFVMDRFQACYTNFISTEPVGHHHQSSQRRANLTEHQALREEVADNKTVRRRPNYPHQRHLRVSRTAGLASKPSMKRST
ncbi:unnamed protein product [Sphagnum balticum]